MKQFSRVLAKTKNISKRKLIAVFLAAILIVAIIVAGIIYLLDRNEAGNKLNRNIDAIYASGECEKGLNELGGTDQNGLDDAQKEKLLLFKTDCNYKLNKYDEALKYSGELLTLYQANGTDANKVTEIMQLRDRIQISQETERLDKENAEKEAKKPKDTYNGPLL